MARRSIGVAVAKRVLPSSAQQWLRDRRNPRLFVARLPIVGPALDRWAVRWALEALVIKTEDARTVRWLDRPIWQYPLDAWILQEMIAQLRPDLVVETGTHRGGSAYYYACVMDLMGTEGEVITIDLAALSTMPHRRITYLAGSSTDQHVVEEVRKRAGRAGIDQVLVVLDSDHREEHVLSELELYAPLVPVGGYVHVQDGCVDELPLFRGHSPGPARAARRFLDRHPEFVRDLEVERRYLLTCHPMGWLRRVH